MVKIYLCSQDMTYSLLLPVTPAEIQIADALGVRQYETANAGNMSSIGFKELCTVSFSSHFPSTHRDYSLGDAAYGIGYIPLVSRFIDNRQPCRLIISGMAFDKTMILERFDYSTRQGNDVYYSMSFTEYRRV